MRIFLFLLLSLSIWGCTTVEVTKEVIKVTNTITDQVKEAIPKNKIEKKAFEVSKQYYTIRDYSSAIKSLDNFIADNPGTIFREEALYYRWLSQYEIAVNSIESRINERVTELERSLENFLRYYPDTIFIDDLSEKINNAKQLL